MSLSSHIKDHQKEKEVFFSRIVISSLIGIGLIGIVILRLIQLQVIEYDFFSERAHGNRINIRATLPSRGIIYDRNGKILAENKTSFQLVVIPEQIDEIEETLNKLANLNLISPKDINSINNEINRSQKFKPVTIRSSLDDKEMATFAANMPNFPGVNLQPRLIRHYPQNEYTSHVVGYIGAISKNDLNRLNRTAYDPNEKIGKTGTELFNENRLHGSPGFYQYIANARGREIPINSNSIFLDDKPSTPGSNIYLTIDLQLQKLATELLDGRKGAVVAVDPNNGEILTLVSSPAYNPNLFANNLTENEYRKLQSNKDQPLFNRAVLGSYSPGSTIKPIIGLAALQIGATNLNLRHICRGFYSLPGNTHRYRDWLHTGHGSINLHTAISQSCDVYFYEISNTVGIDVMHEYLTSFGLGEKTNIELAGERIGLVPSTEWKRTMFSKAEDKRWYPGETVIASIGQGYMLATPLQLAVSTAALAMRGKRFQTNLVLAHEDPLDQIKEHQEIIELDAIKIDNQKHWEEVISAMQNVMQGNGTARNVGKDAPYRMAGKSGTVQVISIGQEEEYDEDNIEEKFRDHALFISFAPTESPKIAVSVIIENGQSGSQVAAPIAKAIMDKYLGY